MSEANKTSKLSELINELNGVKPASIPEQSDNSPTLATNDEIIDMGENFNFDDYQVVRREFFAHLREPSCNFNDYKFYVNVACLTKFANSDYAQVLVNQDKRILALRPCEENTKDSFQWSYTYNGKKKPKPITCKLFFAKIVKLMNWEPKFRYRILGKLIYGNGEYLIAFDLTAAEIYQKYYKEGEKPKISRTPVYPSEWQNQFGLPYNEHKQSMQVNLFEGYAIYTIKENEQTDLTDNKSEVTANG